MNKCKVKKLRKIKTVYKVHNDSRTTEDFDRIVNDFLNDGWRIGEIRIIEAQSPNVHDVYYARLEWWEA